MCLQNRCAIEDIFCKSPSDNLLKPIKNWPQFGSRDDEAYSVTKLKIELNVTSYNNKKGQLHCLFLKSITEN